MDDLNPTASADTWQDANAACHTISDTVGQATGAIYGYGAEVVTANPAVGYGVNEVISNFVTENWGHVCDLPGAIFGSESGSTE